jgi:Flp pilus assembly protein TadB
MSAPSSAPPTREGAPRARASYANPGMRISDAERAEVADRLSAHYGDGRLDSEEFGRRMDQAMNAKTQGDLHGLFADLPGDDEPATAGHPASGRVRPGTPGQRREGRYNRLLAIGLVAVVAAFAVHALGWLLPWVLVAAVVYVWLRRTRRPHAHQLSAQQQPPPQQPQPQPEHQPRPEQHQ